MGDFNVALVIVAALVSVLVLLVSVYLLVNYQHPDDANQAYFPKLVVVLGITVAVHASLSAMSCSSLGPLYDDLLLQAASRGAATDDWPYAIHLLAHLFLNDLQPWGHAMCRSRGLGTSWSRANGQAGMGLEACRQRRQCAFLSKSWSCCNKKSLCLRKKIQSLTMSSRKGICLVSSWYSVHLLPS